MKVLMHGLAVGLMIGLVALIGGDQAPQIAAAAPAIQSTCDEAPGIGYTQFITGMVEEDELQIRVSDRFGGAVESLTWRGKEFINIFDHGRQISYAWGMDNYGECYNPTEPGSAADLFAPTSTSELLSVCKTADDTLTTTTRLAFWLAPGETGFCEGVTTAVNETLVSDQVLEKTMQIGYEGIDNVIAFNATITNPEDHSFMRAEIPTAYLTYEFTAYWNFNPQTGELTTPESDPLHEPWSFESVSTMPAIISTPDGNYAMGAFYPGAKRVYYGIHNYTVANPQDTTNKWNIVIEENPYPAGTYNYQTFAIVGTLEQVQEAMEQLYALHPTDFTPPMGYVDLVNCTQLAGWTWDPGLPDEPLEVALYDVEEDGTETLISTFEASLRRSDLVTALGDNGRHGYDIPTPLVLQDGKPHTIRFYGLNPDPALPDVALMPTASTLECAAVEIATDVPSTATGAEEAASREEEEAPPVRGRPGCLPGTLMLVLGAVGISVRRRELA